MEAATRMLEALGVPSTMTEATTATLDRIARTGIPPIPDATHLPTPDAAVLESPVAGGSRAGGTPEPEGGGA
jgi:hypothetical protein